MSQRDPTSNVISCALDWYASLDDTIIGHSRACDKLETAVAHFMEQKVEATKGHLTFRLVPKKEKATSAKIHKTIMDFHNKGTSLRTLADMLNDMDAPTPDWARACKWSNQMVHRYLTKHA